MPFPVDNIRMACAIKGTTIAELERDLKIGNGVIARWEHSKKSPPYDRLVAIAERLGTTVDALSRPDIAAMELTANVLGGTLKSDTSSISSEAHHIGVLFDRADEKDKLLTHTVLDKYEETGVITSINAASNNPGGFIELDVYDEPAAAGLGNYLDAPQARREQFPSIIVPKGATFGIRISGNSMEPMVADGSTVFVRQTMAVEPGRVGIFVLNGASFCKQLIVDRTRMEVRLRSLNPEYADIIVQPSDTLVTIGQVL